MPVRKTIVALGEILWDLFPDGPHFGGAPANFAASAAELGGNDFEVFMVGSVGRDDLGDRALAFLSAHGVRAEQVSRADQPTGQVIVTLDDAGQPSFEIAADTAWDNIVWTPALAELAQRADAVCFGTLAQRSLISGHTIRRFVESTRADCWRILDINLRPPFWNEEVLRRSFPLANVVKLNDAELRLLGDVFAWSGSEDELLAQLFQAHRPQLIALTRGAEGALLASATGERSDMPGQSVAVADTVGAGDAYTATLAIGLLNKLPLDTINKWASRVAAYVCTQAGAAPQLPGELRQPS